MSGRLREALHGLLDRWPPGSFERRVLSLEVLPEAVGEGWSGSADAEAVGLLIPLLTDPDAPLRRRAVEALVRVVEGTGAVGLALLQGLDRHPACRDGLPLARSACLSTARWEERLAAAAPDLGHNSPGRRRAALRGLSQWPAEAPPEAFEVALGAIRPSDDFAHRCAALECAGRLLGGRAGKGELEALRTALSPRQRLQAEDAGYCPEVAWALAVAGGPFEKDLRDRVIRPLLSDTGASRRQSRARRRGLAALTSGSCPEADLIALAVKSVADPRREVRWQALWSLAEASWRWPAADWPPAIPQEPRAAWRQALIGLAAPALPTVGPGAAASFAVRYRLLGEACRHPGAERLEERLTSALSTPTLAAEAALGWAVLHRGQGLEAAGALSDALPNRPNARTRLASGAALGLILGGGPAAGIVRALAEALVGRDPATRAGASLGLLAAGLGGTAPWARIPRNPGAPWARYLSCAGESEVFVNRA